MFFATFELSATTAFWDCREPKQQLRITWTYAASKIDKQFRYRLCNQGKKVISAGLQSLPLSRREGRKETKVFPLQRGTQHDSSVTR